MAAALPCEVPDGVEARRVAASSRCAAPAGMCTAAAVTSAAAVTTAAAATLVAVTTSVTTSVVEYVRLGYFDQQHRWRICDGVRRFACRMHRASNCCRLRNCQFTIFGERHLLVSVPERHDARLSAWRWIQSVRAAAPPSAAATKPLMPRLRWSRHGVRESTIVCGGIKLPWLGVQLHN